MYFAQLGQSTPHCFGVSQYTGTPHIPISIGYEPAVPPVKKASIERRGRAGCLSINQAGEDITRVRL